MYVCVYDNGGLESNPWLIVAPRTMNKASRFVAIYEASSDF